MENTLKTLCLVFLIIIALGAVGGIAGLLNDAAEPSPSPSPTVINTAPPTDRPHENTDKVTWVKTPDQTEASLPSQFKAPEMEEFKLPDGENLAQGKRTYESGHADIYIPKQAVDGKDKTYWEGDAFPGWLAIDLADEHMVSKVAVRLPPIRIWSARTQVFSISVSMDGENYTVVAEEKAYVFDPVSGNGVLVEFAPAAAKFVRIDFVSNTGAGGGQMSEFCVFE